ncbi:fumarylacetoacetate hydrolase family protein [Rhodococcus fascians]|nr:fumarylacetoacetate hydrolase family protein [Rhodococcus fascians]MBY3995185.1 fumarylacetoacetate hydrolase family protein [Rhodococcus fascians]MBY4000495.1 fumarylacetoacetate hydrolase family protein [Rhodococcus fascians]MBY4005523.1 fumarylacetoacetate hydrolase family protein [Rhodococcus fascians]MBY4016356.1 fumarylacetoacetate hydrolase family protein [Rhodococcus fascians]
MRLVTVRTDGGTSAARVDGDDLVLVDATDVGSLLGREDWQTVARAAEGERMVSARADLAPVVPAPSKIFCVGLNYRRHILEMGRDLPRSPTLFAKFAEALVGPRDDIVAPSESVMLDWEAELAVVVGRTVRRADTAEAERAIAGFTVLNDVTVRDWQYRTTQWLQGKTFEATTPVGPSLVTPDELPGGVRPRLDISCLVNGETVQSASTDELVFDPVALVGYVSTIVTLRPGDLIATGTPGGVGHARTPPRYLAPGDVLTTRVSGVGELTNLVCGDGRSEKA